MIKSISAWAFRPQRPVEELFRVARDHGFQGVEVSIGAENTALSRQVSFDSTPDECVRVRRAAEEAGVQLVSLASGFGWEFPITSPDPTIRAQGIELTQKALRVAKQLGVEALLLVPGGVGVDFIQNFVVTDYEVAYENALSSLKQIAPLAERLGVWVGVENVWNKFLLSPLEFRHFLDEINSPFIGCYFDVGNVIATGFPQQWVRILGQRIQRVHFKDFRKEGGSDGFCSLTKGDVEWPAVMEALRNAGYNGPVTAEFFNAEDQLSEISRAMDTILGR